MMKNAVYLQHSILNKKSFLCVGLDPDPAKIPVSYLNRDTAYLDFCNDVIQQTCAFAIAYKINIAFFEALGPKGWEQLESLVKCIPQDCLVIADAKRADIGNTSKKYAEYYFERLNVDALTLHPYMGMDSLLPFLEYRNKWSVILALTSNSGAADFEKKTLSSGIMVFEEVVNRFTESEFSDHIMFVAGATQTDQLSRLRMSAPKAFFLVPGVGEQGGNLTETIRALRNDREGIIINVGRSIMYPYGNQSKPDDIRMAALDFHQQMSIFF